MALGRMRMPGKGGIPTALSLPRNPESTVMPAIPQVRFTDITALAGIRFEHFGGATGEKLLPETMGSGVAFFDFDQDGDADLFFANGASWSWTPADSVKAAVPALYRNDGGHFEDVTVNSGLAIRMQGMGWRAETSTTMVGWICF